MSLPLFPRSGDKNTCNLREAVTKPNIEVGEYTYYHDFDDPLRFQDRNVLYHYPVNNDRLIIGKFCSIAHGAKFLFNGGNHKQACCVNYPFAIFGELWVRLPPSFGPLIGLFKVEPGVRVCASEEAGRHSRCGA